MQDIHDYQKRLVNAKRRLAKLENAQLLLNFVAHLEALGLSTGRVAKYANHVCALTKRCPFNATSATRGRRRKSDCMDKHSAFSLGVGWRCGVVEFRRLRKGGMWLLRTPRKLVKQGFRKEIYLGYVGEAEADSLRNLTAQEFWWKWQAFMEQSEQQGRWLKRYWVKILKRSEAWKLLRGKKPLLPAEMHGQVYAPDSWVGVLTQSYYPLLRHMSFDLSLVGPENEASRRVFFTRIVPRWANEAGFPVNAAVMAFGYAVRRFGGGYSPQAVRLFMPPLEEIENEEEFNRLASEVERKIVRVAGLQRWRVRNMWLYKSFLNWLNKSLAMHFREGDLWNELNYK